MLERNDVKFGSTNYETLSRRVFKNKMFSVAFPRRLHGLFGELFMGNNDQNELFNLTFATVSVSTFFTTHF